MKSIGLTNIKFRLSRGHLLDLRSKNWIEFFFLALVFGGYVLLVLISAFLPGGIVLQDQKEIFVLAWILAPLCAVLSVPLFVWICQKHLETVPSAPSILLFINALIFTCLTTGLNLSWQFTKSVSLISFMTYAAILLIPFINLITILALKTSKTKTSVGIGPTLVLGSLGLLNFIGLFPFYNESYSTSLLLTSISINLAIVAIFIKRPQLKYNRSLLLGIDFLVVFSIFLTCFDPSFLVNIHHQSFFLGPVNRLLHGGAMLVDTFSQYGVLVINFVAFLVQSRLMPLTFQGFSLAIAVLMTIQFSIVYLFLIVLVKDRFYAILLLVVTLLFGVFGGIGANQTFPSTGPLRFGLAYLILTSVLFRRRFPRLRRASLIFDYFLIGIASLWSIETFVYTIFAYLGICLFESLGESGRYQQMIWSFFRRLFWLFIAIAIFQILFALGTYARAGVWPDWGTYFGFIKLYLNGFGGELIDLWSPWIFPVAIYFFSLMVFVFRYLFLKDLAYSLENELVFGLTFFGISQYTYFLGRSHPNNLFHIQMPAVIIAGYWFTQLISHKNLPADFRSVIKFVFFSAAALSILTTFPSAISRYQQNNTGFKIVFKTIHSLVIGRSMGLNQQWSTIVDSFLGGPPPPLVSDAVELLRRNSPGDRDATILLPPQYVTEILMLTERINRFPISEPQEDSLSDGITNRILTYPDAFMINDVVLLVEDPNMLANNPEVLPKANSLIINLIIRMCSEFSFKEIERTSSGVLAVRLDNFDGNLTPYCVAMESLGTP